MHTEEVIAKLRQKQRAAKCFFWMQAWFVFVGLVDLILGMTVAHSSGYGHDYSMYAFIINGAIMLCLAALGLIGATKKKSLLPFHFYMTLILANMTLFISIYTLAREGAVNNYIRQNFEHMALDKDEPKTVEEMIEDIDALMTIVGVMGFVTVLTYVGSEAILLWLLGTTRTISSILVTIDGTFICGGLSVFFLASSANSETTAFGPLLSVSIWLAFPIALLMIVMGVLFAFLKQKALAEPYDPELGQRTIWETHPAQAQCFAITLAVVCVMLVLCGITSITQYSGIDESIQTEWATEDFRQIRRDYLSHTDAADELRGRALEIILGYFSLLLFMAEVALMGWYIFSQYRVEKMRQLKVERNRSRNVSRDQLRRKKGGAKHVVNICCGVCIVFLFGITWIVSSAEQMCTSSPALVGLKVELVVRRTVIAGTWVAFFEECQQ